MSNFLSVLVKFFRPLPTAITENPSLVAGMKRYFDFIRGHDSEEIGD